MTNSEIKDPHYTDHLANERTFLAWIRTNLGIIAFGFVIEKFGVFIKQMGLILGPSVHGPSHGYSIVIGIVVIAFGIIMSLAAYINFKHVQQQIEQRHAPYRSSLIYPLLVITIMTVGLFLMMYLIQGKL